MHPNARMSLALRGPMCVHRVHIKGVMHMCEHLDKALRAHEHAKEKPYLCLGPKKCPVCTDVTLSVEAYRKYFVHTP